MSLLGGLLGIGGKLISGIFGSKDKKTTSSVDYVQMVKNAQAAGFNPLTALRNGGAAGFTTSTTSGGGPTFGAAVGDAMMTGADWWDNYDPLKERRSQAEYDLINAQLRNTNAQTDALEKYGSLNVPVRTAGQVTEGSNPASRPAPLHAPEAPVTPGYWTGGKYYPGLVGESTAQEAEDNFGEIGGEFQGASNWLKQGWFQRGFDPGEYTGPMPKPRPKNLGRFGHGTPTLWSLTPTMR